jgi:hypothetical protein
MTSASDEVKVLATNSLLCILKPVYCSHCARRMSIAPVCLVLVNLVLRGPVIIIYSRKELSLRARFLSSGTTFDIPSHAYLQGPAITVATYTIPL